MGCTKIQWEMHMQQRMGSYLLLEKLAGGRSEVFLAKSADPFHLGRVLALKRLRADLCADPSFIALFVQELRQVVKLSQDNIVRTFELGRADNGYYTAMEYVPGLSLAAVLHRSRQLNTPMGEQATLLLGAQICDALAYAHTLRTPCVHRDVCPDNVLVGYGGHIKLINFGLAKAASVVRRVRRDFFQAHYGYVAPEQLCGRTLDGRVDLFALGAVLLEMVTGTPLHAGCDDAEILRRLRTGHVPVAPGLAVDVEAVLRRALDPQPDGRYPHAQAMGQALRDILVRRFGGGDPKLLARLMVQLFPEDVDRETTKWKGLVRTGWLPPQATSVVRWLGTGLPTVGTPVARRRRAQAKAKPRPQVGSDAFVVFMASVMAGTMVALSYVLTHPFGP